MSSITKKAVTKGRRVKYFVKKSRPKQVNQYIDENISTSSIGGEIIANDSSTSIIFNNTVLYNIISNEYSNYMYNIKHSLIEKVQNNNYYIKEIEGYKESKTFTDINGYVTNTVHSLNSSIFTDFLNKSLINEEEFIALIRTTISQRTILIVDSTTSDIAGKEFFNPIKNNKMPLYPRVSVKALGADSMDATLPGLTAEEAYRIFLHNGERFQQIAATYDTDLSSINPGQFDDKRMHILSGATLSNPINKI